MGTEFDADNVSAPRLVVMKRAPGGYGFNLHGERNVHAGQTISAVDDGSEAQKGGLRVGDKVVEVNGENCEKFSHSDVVKRIKMNEKEVTLLVIDHITEAYLKQEGRVITADMANLMTVYEPKVIVKEPEPVAPEVAVESPVNVVEETNVVESAPPPEVDTTQVDAGESELANDATTPEEVKQLNEVLENEQEEEKPAPVVVPEPEPVETTPHHVPEPEPQPEPLPVLNNGTTAPQPVQAPAQPEPMAKPTAKPLRSTIKQHKVESWEEKYKKFQQL